MAKMLFILSCMIILQGVTPLKKMQTLATPTIYKTNNYIGVMDSEKKYFLEVRDGIPVMTSKPKDSSKWAFVTSGSYIYLKYQETGEVLQATKDNKTKIASKSNMASKLWSLVYYTKEKRYAFINKYYNTAIDFNGGDYGEGNPIILTPFSKEKSQLVEILQPDQISKDLEMAEEEEEPKELEPGDYYISACTDATCTKYASFLNIKEKYLYHELSNSSNRFTIKRNDRGVYAILVDSNTSLVFSWNSRNNELKIFTWEGEEYNFTIIKQGKNSYIIRLGSRNICIDPSSKEDIFYLSEEDVTYYKFEKDQEKNINL